ncbi:IS110 family transposase [Rickettsiales endosymbiont of Peranema trichophorum]|uniref:IS110 family transposase n=1 Tax=Rickettsiales endosymbiont of Peranema trichophorum TaxID=2486577 RepID=UPI0010237F40|nr:IS110 family transposase [Rickettsiales endosymbiont of Peranema trichophorum]RZI47702.1 IS110 family transposase [Rickettsiales endosymbiont of Peranema trichophorum]
MTLYQHFLGIDIGKFTFVVSLYGTKSTSEYENSSTGIGQFVQEYKNILPSSLCVLETTGGYELEVLYSLIAQGFKAHRADTRKVKSFIRSLGSAAKTDALDAKALAAYGQERSDKLPLFEAQSKEAVELFQLVQRRSDLKITLVAEKNRLQAPCTKLIRDGILVLIAAVKNQIDVITDKIKLIIENNPELKRKKDILKTIPGIGDIVAFELLILLPELGTLCRRKIASLGGVAPRANDSGKFSGYRRTGPGRCGVKPILFIAAMAARNSKTHFKEFYEKLVNKGKKKMVALTALMRKILVIANARLREEMCFEKSQQKVSAF